MKAKLIRENLKGWRGVANLYEVEGFDYPYVVVSHVGLMLKGIPNTEFFVKLFENGETMVFGANGTPDDLDVDFGDLNVVRNKDISDQDILAEIGIEI